MQPFFHKYSLLGAVCLAAAALTSCRTIFERGEEGVAAVRYHRPGELQRHEVAAHVGIWSPLGSKYYDDAAERITKSTNLEIPSLGRPHYTIGGSYHYHFNDRLALGFETGLIWCNQRYDNSLSNRQHELQAIQRYGEFREAWMQTHPDQVFPWNDWKPTALPEEYAIIRDRLIFLMPSLKYNWAYFRRASLYNRFALGVSYQHLRTDSRDLPALVQTDLHDWHLAIHITFIGLDFGAGPLHGFCEFGVGANGFLTAGLSYRF